MANTVQEERAQKKISLYTKLLKEGKSKMEAMKVVRKKLGGGMDSCACSKVARDLGITNGQMKSRAIQYKVAKKAGKVVVSKEAAKLVKAPKEQELQVMMALPQELTDLIRRRMEAAKEKKTVFVLDLGMEFDVEERKKMIELMQSQGLDKLSVFGDGFEARRTAGVFTGKL